MKVYSFFNTEDNEYYTNFRDARREAIKTADYYNVVVEINLCEIEVSRANMLRAIDGEGFIHKQDVFATIYPKGNKT